MRLIKEGVVPPIKPPWWTKVLFVCKNCGAQFKFDKEDARLLDIISERRLDGNTTLQCTCVTDDCNKQISLSLEAGEIRILEQQEDPYLK
jgi:hypothetical protein